MKHRRDSSRLVSAPWLLLPLALGGCLARLPDQPGAAQIGTATVPPQVFAATPIAAAPPAIPAGRYILGPITGLNTAVPTSSYAAALLDSGTKGIQIALQVADLSLPAPPPVNYELVTASGVFRPLADGEWDQAIAQGTGWTIAGTLIFVVPRDLRAGQLMIVDYYYPQARSASVPTPAPLTPLIRRTLVSFALDRLP